MLRLKLQYFGHLMRRVDSFEKTLMLGGIGAGGEGDHKGWDGWMASPTRWTWVCVNSGGWWWTGSSGVLWFMGSQRVGHGVVIEQQQCFPGLSVLSNCGKFLKKWEYQTTWPASWEIYMHVKKQQLEPNMKQQTGSKLGKEYDKTVYCHPAYLTSMQSTSCKMPGWMKQKLESILPGELSITSDMQMTPPL